VWARKIGETRATLNDDGQWPNGYFDTSSTYQEFLVGLVTGYSQTRVSTCSTFDGVGNRSIYHPVGASQPHSTQPQPYLFYFSANQTTFDNIIPSNFNSALVRFDISQNTILEQPCPFTPYHRTTTTTPLNSLLSYFYSVVSFLFYFHSTIRTTHNCYTVNIITCSC
jgi:hypothetical protein